MVNMKRVYLDIIKQHFVSDQQMLFLAGPRQVGKTTLSKELESLTDNFNYLSWDTSEQRKLILLGPISLAEKLRLISLPSEKKPIIVFDEIHKYSKWRNFLKGFYDNFKGKIHIIVTGSAKLNIFRRGADSLMGRYFLYRVCPLSVAECMYSVLPQQEISKPKKILSEQFNDLLQYGGFPEPFVKRNSRFSNKWKILRQQQLFSEDIRDLSQVQEIDQMEVLAEILQHDASQLLSYSNLANKVNVSIPTIKRWLAIFQKFYYCFTLQPWAKNVVRSLLKEPKIYLWDWSLIDDVGRKAENFIAVHLLKAVYFWTDQGLGNYGLYFIRDKEKREVDFVVTKDHKPWFLVEVKQSDNQNISKSLLRFHEHLKTMHAFQVVIDAEYRNIDCFSYHQPIIVSAKTFLSQLV